MRNLTLVFFSLVLAGCVNVAKKENINHHYSSVNVETIYERPINIRALKVNPDHIFFAGSQGKFGYLNTADHSVAYMGKIHQDSIETEFRAIGSTKESDFVLSAGNPALLYKVNFFGKRKLMYEEKGEKVFYDAMAFWNENEGIAMGDPTTSCMSILITRDGGESWEKVSCEQLPPSLEGEAAFAASNSNIAIVGDKVWLISGGKQSRVFYSADKGNSWEVFDTPLIQGKPTTGAYSVDFYDDKRGVIFGGDYTDPSYNKANKAITTDGGKTWSLIAQGEEPGYKSCVKFVPNSGGKELVAVGFTGISYSSDYGDTWIQLSDEAFYTVDFLNEFTAYAAGKDRIAKLTFMENGLKN